MVLPSPSHVLIRVFPRLCDDVDIDQVPADMLGVVERSFHPAYAGMWLRWMVR